jgi:hypothetical protein
MTEGTVSKQTCPYLGLTQDRETHFSYPESAHRCFSAGQPAPIPLGQQSTLCLTREFPTCPRYLKPFSEDVVAPESVTTVPEARIKGLVRGSFLWIMVGVIIALLVVFAALYYSDFAFRASQQSAAAFQATPTPTLSPTPTPSLQPTATPGQVTVIDTPTPVAIAFPDASASTPTSESGEKSYALSAVSGDIGWVTSGEDRGNHFGDSFLYAGIFNGQVYQAAFQFDLRPIPRGAPIYSASIEMTGLRSDRLGEGSTWTLRLLAPEIDANWRRHTYQEIFNAAALQVLSPILGSQDLAEGQVNVFELSAAQIKILEARLIGDEKPTVSFRVDGPLVGPDNLFGWDTGYGSQSQGNKVILRISAGPAPATPPPYAYVVVTSTPTPENVLTAAAVIAQMTADATRIGTATPTPPNMATPTPIPDYLIIVPTETPANAATARAMVAKATAEAVTTGTATPVPTNAITATPVPTVTPTPPHQLVLITSTPTPDSIFAAATLSVAETAQARAVGTPTALPENWVTPLVVTSTPTPASQATAEYLAALATAEAFTTGTPTPTPVNMVTATPTPAFVLLEGELPPMSPTPVPAPVRTGIPAELVGKIGFKSDRTGEELIYVINPDGSGLALLSDRGPYDLAGQADAYSSDGRFHVLVEDALIDTGREDSSGNVVAVQLRVPTLFSYDAYYKAKDQVTHFGSGIAYDPAWSPTAEQIAFVSDDSGNDEIWVINRDGTGAVQLTRNTWEWDKHPSWSPDGSKIAFWSNRTGHSQIFVMDADGGNLYSLSRTGFNDWDPVWFKYSNLPEGIAQP